jgi:cytochrome b pre-mRNA-processing protein 3
MPSPPFQVLYDDFQTDVEERARSAGVRVRLQKQLTELEKQFYGSSMAYDRAMAGEEALDRALLRNVYLQQSDSEPSAQLLARYVRRCGGAVRGAG